MSITALLWWLAWGFGVVGVALLLAWAPLLRDDAPRSSASGLAARRRFDWQATRQHRAANRTTRAVRPATATQARARLRPATPPAHGVAA